MHIYIYTHVHVCVYIYIYIYITSRCNKQSDVLAHFAEHYTVAYFTSAVGEQHKATQLHYNILHMMTRGHAMRCDAM